MKKRICMVAYTTYSIDARVRREAETIASLAGHSVSVLALKEKPKARTYVLDGVEIRELNVGKYRGKNAAKYVLSYLHFLWVALLRCIHLQLKKPNDVIHIHNMPNFLIIAALVPRLCGAKVILDIHDTVIETYSTKFTGLKSRILTIILVLEEVLSCKFANKIICVNSIQRQALVDRGIPESKLMISMNLPDPKRFSTVASGAGAPERARFKMVYFGTISSRLGVDLAIRAVAQTRVYTPNLEFYIFGTGEAREDCIKLSDELGVSHAVHFSAGSVPLDDLVAIVRSMDLVIVPNRKNAATELMLPVKMLEGIALGLPVIAPRLKTIEHYFDGDQVFFFEPDDVSSLAGAIRMAYEDEKERRVRAANAARFLEKYNWDTQKAELIQMYRSLTLPC